MTDIKHIYTSRQSLLGTVSNPLSYTVRITVHKTLRGYSSNHRLALACIFVYWQSLDLCHCHAFTEICPISSTQGDSHKKE